MLIQSPKLKKRIDERLKRIANFLLLNASFTDNLGLLNGKMGVAIFFYKYSLYTGIKIFEDYAGELIDEIYEEINVNSPIDFADGLTGIGWGIEYLAENKFVEGSTDHALTEIDNAVYRSSINTPFPLKSDNDLFGYGLYFIARLRENGKDDDNLSTLFKKQHLIYLTDECERILVKSNFSDDKIQSLKLTSFNSFLLFLYEIQRLGLFPVKVEKILQSVPDQVGSYSNDSCDKADLYLLQRLLESLIKCDVGKNTREALKKAKVKIISENNVAGDILVNRFIKNAWYKILYRTCLSESDAIEDPQKVFAVIDNEENWESRLKNTGGNDLGLTGLAGLGFGFLEILMKAHKVRK